MNKPAKLLLLLGLLLLVLASPSQVSASASNIYVAPAAAGAANGTNCANAYAASFFNTSGNWGSGSTQIGPGTNVHLCSGTYSYAGTSCGLTFQGSGSSGNSITLIADQGAATITAPAWVGTGPFALVGPICTGSQNYLVINGANNLTLQATNNGTLLAYQADYGNGIVAQNSNYLTIENLTIANIYVHACAEPVSNCTDENGQSTGCISATGSNVTIAYVTGHDAKWCINAGSPTSVANTNQSFHHNTLYNIDHGIAVGMGGVSSTLSGLSIHDNDISQFQNWDDKATNNHHDGIHVWSYNSGDNITGAQIYNNYIHGDWGANVNAGLYAEAMTGMPNAFYFNNIVVDQSSVSHLGCGDICLEINGVSVLNNTIVGGGTALNFYGTSIIAENNTVQGAHEAIAIETGASAGTVDYNNYYNIGGSGWNQTSFSNWKTSCLSSWASAGCEAHSTTGNPLLNGSYQPTSAAVVKQACNLNNLGVTPLNSDNQGHPRPVGSGCQTQGTSAPWDIGALNAVGGSPTQPNPPIGLTGAVH